MKNKKQKLSQCYNTKKVAYPSTDLLSSTFVAVEFSKIGLENTCGERATKSPKEISISTKALREIRMNKKNWSDSQNEFECELLAFLHLVCNEFDVDSVQDLKVLVIE